MLLSRIIRPCGRALQQVSLRRASILSTEKLDATVEDKTGICRLVMKNAPVNVLEKDVLAGIRDVVVEADKSPNISSLVVSSAFPKIFSAGLDVKELLTVDEDETRFREYWASLQETITTLYLMRGASVAAMNGTCVAGGFLLALACDYRIAAEGTYRLRLNEPKLGIDVPFFGTEMFKAQVGQREAMSSLPYGQFYDVPSAHRVGVVEEVCPAGELENAVNSFLSAVLSIPSEPRHTTKIHLRHMTLAIMKQTLEMDMEHKVEVFRRPETKQHIMDYIMAATKKQKL